VNVIKKCITIEDFVVLSDLLSSARTTSWGNIFNNFVVGSAWNFFVCYASAKPGLTVGLTIFEHRRRLKSIQISPSLKRYLLRFQWMLPRCESRSISWNWIAPRHFPPGNPIHPEEALNPDYLPDWYSKRIAKKTQRWSAMAFVWGQ